MALNDVIYSIKYREMIEPNLSDGSSDMILWDEYKMYSSGASSPRSIWIMDW